MGRGRGRRVCMYVAITIDIWLIAFRPLNSMPLPLTLHLYFLHLYLNLSTPIYSYLSLQVFEGLIAGSVPVYRGCSGIARMMPSATSFIDANSMTATELGTLLNRLSNNEEEYNAYMAFKQQPLSEEFRNVTMMSYAHPTVLCRLCEFADTFRNTHTRRPRGRRGKKQGGAIQG